MLSALILAVAGTSHVAAAGPDEGLRSTRVGPAVAGAWMAAGRSPSGTHTELVPVLMYHRISCPERGALYPGLWVCPRTFDRTMRMLKGAGWETITSHGLADALAAGRSIPHKRFVIVIDDGDRDGYDAAYPILERYDFEAVFAVVVGRVEARRQAMTWAELIELEGEGHEIADHSMSHADLRRWTASGLRRQIEQSADRLRRHLGHRPWTFVYPYGARDQNAIDQVRASGFLIAYTTVYGGAHTYRGRFTSPRDPASTAAIRPATSWRRSDPTDSAADARFDVQRDDRDIGPPQRRIAMVAVPADVDLGGGL